MAKVICTESGYDFITLYFTTQLEALDAGERLWKYLVRVGFKNLDIQRKNLIHKPGDVPHFHNGVDADKGPHFHILYPSRPTDEDWAELKELLGRRLVDIQLDGDTPHEEIS